MLVVALLAAPADDTAGCHISYRANADAGGVTAVVVITNTGRFAITSWTLHFELPDRQRLVAGKNATFTQSGTAVTGNNLSHNGHVEPGESAYPSYFATGGDHFATPSAFTVNDIACTT